jgi:putative colanic acid biosynthesis UDP-glucose lipid carrier transferase
VGQLLVRNSQTERYIIVGANNLGVELLRRLPRAGFRGFFDFRDGNRVAPVIGKDAPVGHCRDVLAFTRKHNINTIYVTLPLFDVSRMSQFVRDVKNSTAAVYYVPDPSAFELVKGQLHEIGGMHVLEVCDTPFRGIDTIKKRATDLILAGSISLVLALPFLLIALVVKLTSRGPVLVKELRYTLMGEEIRVLKFRTTRVLPDGMVTTTPIGRLLNSTDSDGLPKLFNVLDGTLSFVGPRPHAMIYNDVYHSLTEGYLIRNRVKPGLTGLAQIHGLGGELNTVEQIRERVRYDLQYVGRWSPWLDVKIVFRAAELLFKLHHT